MSSHRSLTDYDEEAGNDFLRSGNDLRLDLIETSEPPVRYPVSDLARLQPDNNSWSMYQVPGRPDRSSYSPRNKYLIVKVEVIVRRSLSYDLEIWMKRGSQGVIAMDDIAIEYKPVLATADIRLRLSFCPSLHFTSLKTILIDERH